MIELDEFWHKLEADWEKMTMDDIINKTIIISPSTEPFAETIKFYTQNALNILVFNPDLTIRIITKRPSELLSYINNSPIINNELIKQRVIVNISLGSFNSEWWRLVEPNADGPSTRRAAIETLLENGYRISLMICPTLPGYPEIAFDSYGSYIIDCAEEVFCEPLNPRGRTYDVIGEHFPYVKQMKNRTCRSERNLNLIKTAHYFVPAEKLRVLIYRSNLLPEHLSEAESGKYPGTILL